jgi:hypothetical protein
MGRFKKLRKKASSAVQKAAKDPVGAGIGIASAGTLGLTAPIAYVGGLQKGGWKGGESAAGGLIENPSSWWRKPENLRMMGLTTAEIAAVAATGGLAAGGLPIAAGAGGAASVAAPAWLIGSTAAAGGLSALALQGKNFMGGDDGGNAADGMRADEAKAQAEIQAKINRLRGLYGEGDTPDAQAAQAGIDRFISRLSGESEDAALSEAGDAYQADSRAIDDRMFAHGLQGGSADMEARRQALEGFVRNRQKIVNAKASSEQATRAGLRQERLNLERDVAQGTRADPDWNQTAGLRESQLAGSWQKAWQEQLGTLAEGVGAGVANGIRNRQNSGFTNGLQRDQDNTNFFNRNT